MTARDRKRGQVAIFLVLILAGLALMFALNVDVFISSRAKIRLQNAADASALALARWQGITLNLIGELNLAHLYAVCQSNENAMAGIVRLQRRLAFIGPTIGFKAANDLAKENGIRVSEDMTLITRLISEFMDADYRRMLEATLNETGGICAGVDNAAILNNAPTKDFLDAILHHDYRALCRYAGNAHHLPDPPNLDEIQLASQNDACIGSLGIRWENGGSYEGRIGALVDFARDYGLGHVITRSELTDNALLLGRRDWCIYDDHEWHGLPEEFSFSRFPWLTPLRDEYNVTGGSASIRVEGSVALASLTATTNFITAQAAAKVLGNVEGQRVIDVSPPLILPSFTRVCLVPFGVGAVKRADRTNLNYVRGILKAASQSGGSALQAIELLKSDEFRAAAEKWYSDHGHNDTDGCRPPCHGTERGGGTPYGI